MESITEIVKFLTDCDNAYFNTGESLISDSQYDQIKNKLKSLDPTNEYFQVVGSKVRGGKIVLPFPMGSLNQIYNQNELDIWAEKYKLRSNDAVISDKLDGCSCMLVYRSGHLVIAYSRGDGVSGADITRHIKNMPSVPQQLNQNINLVVRGETIMKNSVFSEKYAEDYANPRNMVAGCMNRKETSVSILSDIDFIAYEIVQSDPISAADKSSSIEKLSTLGFNTVKYYIVLGSEVTNDFLEKAITKAKAQSDYELDGIVVTINNYKSVENVTKSSSLNPEHSFKAKQVDVDNVKIATVIKVNWDLSKSGFLKPVVQINPTNLFGTVVTFTSGFNGKYISDEKIGPGAEVKITKAGSVIPYILEVAKPAKEPGFPDVDQFGSYSFNESKVELLVDNHETHPEVIFKQVLHFFETLKIDQLKEASLRKLFDKLRLINSSYESIILTILNLTEIEFDRILGVNGSKIYSSLNTRLQNMPMELFLGGLKYFGFGFGVRKAKALIREFTDISGILNANVDDIKNVEGFDDITARNVVNGLEKFRSFFENVVDEVKFQEKVIESTNLNGLAVCMTGFRDAELQQAIEANGGKVVSGVSKKTTHLLTADLNSNSGKMKKARELGILVMSPDEFKLNYSLL